MAYKQQILLKHKNGITAQWISEDFSWIAVATYQQNEIKIKHKDGGDVIIKKWALTNCSGPWTGTSEDGKSLIILPHYDDIRNPISGEANIILTSINAYIGGKKTIESYWQADIVGLLEDPDMFVKDKEAEAEGRIN